MADPVKLTSEEAFEFIKTPAAPQTAPTENYGVRTTNVSSINSN